MKILVNCTLPFALAHGGHAIQIQRTMSALEEIGLAVEPLRWWDETQTGDLIHYFGRMPADQIHFAHQKKIKIILAELLTAQGSQTGAQRLARKVFRWSAENLAPRGFAAAFNWEPYRLADGFIALTSWEKHLMEHKFGAEPGKIFVVANGVENVFFQSPNAERGPWLRNAFQSRWREVKGDIDYDDWRAAVGEALGELATNTAVFSHFVAINAALASVTGETRVLTFRPDYASITVFEVDNGKVKLVERGPEAATQVL